MTDGPVVVLPTVNVKGVNTPLVRNVHVVELVIIVGFVLERGPGEQGEVKLASVGAKPLPDTVTIVPIGPDVGLSVILGVNATTVKVAVTVGPGTT